MAVKIRLKRMGKKNTPFYRLVVVDSHWRRDGKTIADVGWYDPVKQPAQTSFKEAEIYYWLHNGAQISDTARSLLKNAGIWERYRSGEYKKMLQTEEQQGSEGITSKILKPVKSAVSSVTHAVSDIAEAVAEKTGFHHQEEGTEEKAPEQEAPAEEQKASE
ncbi:MAG: 30S ribosomal protein S16 [bacterium]|jgi:small subunit ribosomal protein S16